MPRLVPEDTKEKAYQLYRTGSSIPEIVERIQQDGDYVVSVSAVQGWLVRYGWKARAEKDTVEAKIGRVSTASDNLYLNAGLLMERAIDLAFNAESESVRAAQQRYLLGSIGISPETAKERMQVLMIRQDQLKQLTDAPIAEIKDAIDVLSKVDDGGDW